LNAPVREPSDEGTSESPRAVIEALRATPLFGTASPTTLSRAAACAEPRRFGDGDVLIRKGEPGRALHVITSGRVEVRVGDGDGAESAVAALGAGEFVGEMSLLTGDPASADVVALGDLETVSVPAPDLAGLVGADPALLGIFARSIAKRLSHADEAVGEARERQQDLTRLLRDGGGAEGELIGTSAEMRKVRKAIDAYAPGVAPVLVRGEEGVGRETVAGLLHRASDRREALVIGVDCGLVSETVWGDPVFGSQGGRSRDRPLCYADLAEGGTLVLKHLERLPPAVQQRLLGHLRAGSSARDVRVVATCAPDADAGGLDDELLAAFAGRVIEVPPLRERKRDLPDIAQHHLRRHAERLEREIEGFSDQALTRLVSHDYLFENDRELEAAVERAVILSDGATVEEEAVFLGVPPSPREGGVNLLRLPGSRTRRLLRLLPGAARAATVLFFAFILRQALFGPPAGEGNLATLLVWSLWWPLLVLSFFFAGRAWCGVCPMGLATAAGDALREGKRRIPAWLKQHDVEIAMAGLFLIVFVEEATHMRSSPLGTGLLLLAILAGAVVTGLLYPRRTWCRHLCPLGGLAGTCATSGLLELRPTSDVCTARCKGHACFKGDEHVAGCPLFNHVMFLDSNRHCVLCLNCVRACPNGSPRLNLRLPAGELSTDAAANGALGRFVLLLLGVVAALAVLQHLEGSAWADAFEARRLPWVTLLLGGGAALPLLLLRPRWRAAERAGEAAARRLWRRVVALTPLVTAGLVAYHLGYVPGLADLGVSLQTGGEAGVTLSVLAVLRVAILLAGLAVTLVVLRRAGRGAEAQEGPEGSSAPAALVAVAWTALLLGSMLIP